MLDGLTPEQFDEWIALERLDPFGDEWLQAGQISAQVHNSVLLALNMTGQAKVKQSDMRSASEFTPDYTGKRKPRQNRMSEAELQDETRSIFGGP